jgi:FKBP-type peptidyl-prolyl cis-trans isomerase FkpA/FKBP-type peptidyl-prolyl cis-trans isomerase FklB
MKSVIGSLILAAALAAPAFSEEVKLETDEQKTIYALGLSLAGSLASYDLSAAELEVLKAGLTDGVLKKQPKVDVRQMQTQMRDFNQKRRQASGEKEKKESDKFLEAQAKEKGAKKTDSGLIYFEVKPGSGESPKATDTVKVHYHGTLRDGTVFDSSVDRGEPATFPLNRVIACWTEGVQRMKVGGKSKLVCPAPIAYGDRGAPPKIMPGAALVFEVELIAIEAPKPAAGGPPSGHP